MATTKMKKMEKEIAKQWESSAGAGIDDVAMDELGTPFVRILDQKSPEIIEDSAKYVQGAKAGMFMNTATKLLCKEMTIQIVNRKHRFLRWIPQDDGGGLVGEYLPNDPLILDLVSKQGKFGKLKYEGHEIQETFTLLCNIINMENETAEPAFIAFKSTQITKYQTMMQILKRQLIPALEPAKTFPMWAHLWTFKTAKETRRSYTFWGFVCTLYAGTPIKSRLEKGSPIEFLGEACNTMFEAGKHVPKYEEIDEEDVM